MNALVKKKLRFHEMKKTKKPTNFEAFRCNISLDVDLLFMKSDVA